MSAQDQRSRTSIVNEIPRAERQWWARFAARAWSKQELGPKLQEVLLDHLDDALTTAVNAANALIHIHDDPAREPTELLALSFDLSMEVHGTRWAYDPLAHVGLFDEAWALHRSLSTAQYFLAGVPLSGTWFLERDHRRTLEYALWILGRSSRYAPSTVEWRDRTTAFEILEWWAATDSSVLDMLVTMAGTEDSSDRAMAVDALGLAAGRGQAAALNQLMRIVGDLQDPLRAVAIRALGSAAKSGQPAVLDLLFDIACDSEDSERDTATRVLAWIGAEPPGRGRTPGARGATAQSGSRGAGRTETVSNAVPAGWRRARPEERRPSRGRQRRGDAAAELDIPMSWGAAKDISDSLPPESGEGLAPLAGRTVQRVIHFAPRRSMGQVSIRDENGLSGADWEIIGEAIGDLTVPAGKELRVSANTGAILGPLADLGPTDLQELGSG